MENPLLLLEARGIARPTRFAGLVPFLLAAISSRLPRPSLILLAFLADCDKNTTVELSLLARAEFVSYRPNTKSTHL
jgi:hypothetical protein